MIIKHLLSLCFLLSVLFSYAKDNESYAVKHIEPIVLISENSVVRTNVTQIDLQKNSAILSKKRAVTLLNKNDFEHYSKCAVFYTSGESVNDFNVVIYDKNGKEIEKLKKKEIEDLAAYSSSLFTDHRLMYSEIKEYAYPFTIEFSYTKKVKDTYLLLPRWEATEYPSSFVEHSSIIIDKPEEIKYTLDYHLHDVELTKNIVTPNKINFEAENIPSFSSESFGPSVHYQKPHISLSLHQFDIEGYEGSFESWSSLGDFYYRLNADRYEIDDQFVEPIKKKVEEAESREEKVGIIYDYLQEKTRYVSVQLGIGGWQSFPAEYVEENSYGDCKALTTYTKALLSYFDIEANPVLIYGDSDNDDSAFFINETIASNAFNHVILSVPNEKDTIWLECTSQVMPFNYLGQFTMDRKGLVVKSNGQSHLVNTPNTTTESDYSTKKIDVFLEETGNAELKMNLSARGILAEDLFLANQYLSKEEFGERLTEIIDLPNCAVKNYTLTPNEEEMAIELTASFLAKNVANKTGSRIFIKPLQFQNKKRSVNQVENRKHPLILGFTYQKNIEVNYHLPQGYKLENMSKEPVSVHSVMGSYEASFAFKEQTFTATSSFSQKHGMYAKEKIKEFNQFIEAVNEAGGRMAVLKSNQ